MFNKSYSGKKPPGAWKIFQYAREMKIKRMPLPVENLTKMSTSFLRSLDS